MKQKSLAAGPTISCGFCLYIMNSECWKVNGSGDSAVVHATAWSYGCFAELKENTEGTTNSTKGHEILETTEYTDYTDY